MAMFAGRRMMIDKEKEADALQLQVRVCSPSCG
jgi:hypothetical protein